MTLPRLSLLVGLCAFAVAVSAHAEDDPAPAVRDGAQLFSPEARHKAEVGIQALREELRKTHPDERPPDVVIETVASLPEDLRKKVEKLKAKAAPDLREWAEQQAEAAGVDGVYVLISADPGHVELVVRPQTRQGEFTDFDVQRLHNLLANMKAGPANVPQRDKKLLAAVAQVRGDLRYNMRPPFPWLAVGGVLVGALGLWGVLGLVRLRLRAADPVPEPDEGRLALFNGLLGGMFGTVAGHWIYDTLFVAASRSAPAEEAAPETKPAAAEGGTDGDDGGAVEPAPAQRAADRLDLAARDEPVDQPSTPTATPS